MGGGHLVRTLSLAQCFVEHGHDCTFLTARGGLDFSLEQNSVTVTEIDPTSPFEQISCKYDLAVIDGYHFNLDFEKEIQKYSRLILSFDDFPHREHACNFLLDPTLNRQENEYEKWVRPQTKLLLGPKYAPLRKQFNLMRESSLNKRKDRPFQNLLINFGLTDPANLTSRLMRILKKNQFERNFSAQVVIGKHAPHLDQIKSIANSSKLKFEIRHSADDMALILSESDLVIGSPGSGAWERCTLGVASLLISQAHNQDQIGASLNDCNAALYLGFCDYLDDLQIFESLNGLLQNNSLLTRMSHSSAKLCDGLGAKRILEVVEKYLV